MERNASVPLGTASPARRGRAGWSAAGRATAAVLLLVTLLPFGAACRKRAGGRAGSELTAEQYYAQGMNYLDRRRFQRARRLFERAMSQANVSRELVADASLGMADAYFRDGGIINVAEGKRPRWTGINAGRSGITVYARFKSLRKTLINPLQTEITFLGSTNGVGVNVLADFLKIG